MGASGGNQAQQDSRTDPLAADESSVESIKTKCKTILKVKVLRSDDDEGIEGIKVEATLKKKAPKKKTSAATTGLADFGEVKSGTYKIELDLSETDLEQYRQHKGTTVKVAKNHTTTVTVKLMPLVGLRVVLLGWDRKKGKDKVLGKLKWKLDALDKTKGKTKKNGLVETKVPIALQNATLEVKLGDPPPPPGADPPVATSETDYPIKIKPDAWVDEDENPVLPDEDDFEVKWTLGLIDLEDADNDDGIKVRLHNLAFNVGDGSVAKVVERAVKNYQAVYLDEDDGSGAIPDVEDDVKTRHDTK